MFYAGVVLIIGLVVSAMVLWGVLERSAVGAGLFALLGTFFGALFAFRLDENKERAKEAKRQVAALNRCLFVLGAQHNELNNINKQLVKHTSAVARAFNLPAYQPVENFSMSQNLDDLGFILESSDPNLLFELHIEQERFDQALATIRHRNLFYVDEVQRQMEKHDLQGKLISNDQLRKLFGERIYEGAVSAANTMYSHVGDGIVSLPEMSEKVTKIAKELFPTTKFIRFTPKGTEA